MTQLIFQGISWTAKIMKTKGSCYVCIPKPLVMGNFLQKGDKLQQFVAKINDTVTLITVLDKEDLKNVKTVEIERNMSLIKAIN